MIMKIFCVYDAAVDAYMQPFFLRSKGEAARMWTDTVNDPKTQFHQHPKDFTLFEIGDFDETTGVVQAYAAKLPVGTALEFKTKHELKNSLPANLLNKSDLKIANERVTQ